jgi:biopolymer transport protein ExbD
MDIAPINLIDLLLVLLIFFVTTTTFLQLKVIALNLPLSTSTQTKYEKNRTVVINIAPNCDIFVDKMPITKEKLPQHLEEIKHHDKKTIFQVGADMITRHQCVVHVLDALVSANISNISILTKNEK